MPRFLKWFVVFLVTLCPIQASAEDATDLRLLQGHWISTLWQDTGEDRKDLAGQKLIIKDDQVTIVTENIRDPVLKEHLENYPAQISLNSSVRPRQIDWAQASLTMREMFGIDAPYTYKGIYMLEGDTLVICIEKTGSSTSVRPSSFESTKENRHHLIMLKRDTSAVTGVKAGKHSPCQ